MSGTYGCESAERRRIGGVTPGQERSPGLREAQGVGSPSRRSALRACVDDPNGDVSEDGGAQVATLERLDEVATRVHPTADLDRLGARDVEDRVVAGKGVRLDVALTPFEVVERGVGLVRVLLARRVDHVAVAPIADVDPQIAALDVPGGLAVLHLEARVVGLHQERGQDLVGLELHEGFEKIGALTDPVPDRRAGQLHSQPRVAPDLAGERQMIAVFTCACRTSAMRVEA